MRTTIKTILSQTCSQKQEQEAHRNYTRSQAVTRTKNFEAARTQDDIFYKLEKKSRSELFCQTRDGEWEGGENK